jgi:TRAP-type mannitol/chloroaromatic compound transport system permease large subunit
MLIMFLLGFVLDFIEITFVVVPIVGPVLLAMGIDPVWLGIMIAINLQTSFLTPPFGFALFYLRGVAPATVSTAHIYRGVIPFVGIQIFALIILAIFPEIVTWLPNKIYGD